MTNGPIEFVKKPLELRIYDREVRLNRPNFGVARQFKKALKERPGEELELLAEFLISLGMEEKMLNELELSHLRKIQDLLLAEGDSKKN